MHQTFYIDIDEEISSVVDRLNKSIAMDNYFVVPKRAIFLQSIVNLKLLKREADKTGKHVVIVTQDEVGASMARRSEIDVRSTIEGLEAVSDAYPKMGEKDINYKDAAADHKEIVKVHKDKQIRLNSVGSSEYYDASAGLRENGNISKTEKALPRHIPINPIVRKTLPQMKKIDARETPKERGLERMFASARTARNNQPVKNNQSAQAMKSKDGKTKKIFFVFMILCLLALIGVAVYLFVPSTEIVIMPNILKNKIDTDVHGAISAQTDVLGIRVIDKVRDISLPYEVSGKSAASGKKAHGSVVIYNEYNSSPQTLVATTRLASADGKIFRLMKSVTVPGTTVVGGSVQPGAIETEIIADQAGSDYNIDPTRFTIPGFSGGPKFDKFYAKSSVAMAGGTSDGDNGGGASSVTQSDIDNAKEKTEAAAKDKIEEDIAGELGAGEVALPAAEKITIMKSAASAKVGDMATSFNYAAQVSVRALVFSENDVKKIVEQSMDKQKQPQDTSAEISRIEYGAVRPDFDNSTLDLKVRSEITIVPDIDSEKIKKELLGKNIDQIADILKKYPSVKNINVQLLPTFTSYISHISQYSQRVNIKIDKSEQ
jgi:hypothetical protein